MKRFINLLFCILLCEVCVAQEFSFAFFTDIHLNPDPKAKSFEGLKQAIKTAESLEVDFILTGGDNVDVDARKKDEYDQAASLYGNYKEAVTASSLPWYFTIGNHDRYWHDGQDGALYGEALFRKFLGETFYSFDHKGWRFIVLNSTEVCDGKYCVSEAQVTWLNKLLEATPADQPIIVSAHVPFLSLYYPVLEGVYTDKDTFANQKEVFDMFARHNLKLVLQGHQHLYEEIKVKGVQFITAGAVSAGWWHGAFHGTEEGFLKVNLTEDDFSWEYVDYGWEVEK